MNDRYGRLALVVLLVIVGVTAVPRTDWMPIWLKRWRTAPAIAETVTGYLQELLRCEGGARADSGVAMRTEDRYMTMGS